MGADKMSNAGRKPNDRSPEAQAQRQKAAIRLREIKNQWIQDHKTKHNKGNAPALDFADRLGVSDSTVKRYCSPKCSCNLPDDLAEKLVGIWETLTGEGTIPEYWQGKTDEKTLDGYTRQRKTSRISTEINAFSEASENTAAMQISLFGQFDVSCFTAKPSVNALRCPDPDAVSLADLDAISEEEIKTVLCSGRFGASFTKDEIEDLKHNIRRTILGWIAEKMIKEG